MMLYQRPGGRSRNYLNEKLAILSGILIILAAFLPMRLNPYNVPNSEGAVSPLVLNALTGRGGVFGLQGGIEMRITLFLLTIGTAMSLVALLEVWMPCTMVRIARGVITVSALMVFIGLLVFLQVTNLLPVLLLSGAGGLQIGTLGPYWTGPAVYAGLAGNALSILTLLNRN